jgi:putative spermidine/putrescine transport system permease protein
MAARDDAFGWLYISPLMLVLLPFFVAPILVVFAASFMQSDGFGGIIASPTLQNYIDIFSSGLTANLYYETVKFTILTWLFSLIIGFWVAYFLVFHIRSPLLAIGLSARHRAQHVCRGLRPGAVAHRRTARRTRRAL